MDNVARTMGAIADSRRGSKAIDARQLQGDGTEEQ